MMFVCVFRSASISELVFSFREADQEAASLHTQVQAMESEVCAWSAEYSYVTGVIDKYIV
jgi:hypothetical protein